MFHKLKQFKELHDKGKIIRSMLAQKIISVERNGIQMSMDGNNKVLSFQIPSEMTAQEIEKIMPNIIEESHEKLTQTMVDVMRNTGGLDNIL